MAFTNNKTMYVSTAAYSAVAQYATSHAYSVGDVVRQLTAPAVGSERCFVVTVAGTSAAEPTWTVTRGAINTDNGVSFQECTGLAALNGDMANTPTWTTGAKNTAVSLGHVIKSDDGTKILICTVAGTAGNGAEPSWGTTFGVDIADGATLKWKLLKISSNVFGNWAAPHSRMSNACATNWGDIAGTKFFASSDHSETTSSAGGPTHRGTLAAPNMWLSVNRAGSVPPVLADLQAGATMENTSNSNFDLNSWVSPCYGFTFRIGNSGNCSIRPTSGSDRYYDTCRFEINSTGTGASFNWAFVSSHGRWRFKSCVFKFGNASQAINAASGALEEYIDCSVDGAGTAPTQLFKSNGNGSIVRCAGCDWSAVTTTLAGVGGGQNNCHQWLFEGCKASLTAPFAFAGSTTAAMVWGFMDRCDTGATNYKTWWEQFTGILKDVSDVIRTGGAVTPGGHAFSWSMTSNANCTGFGGDRFDSIKMNSYNSQLSPDITLTVYGVANTASMPLDTEVFMTIGYPSDASSAQLSHVTTLGDYVTGGSSLTADTSAWDTGATARQNSHAYSVGDVISVASNPDRIFFCTASSGSSSGSEPGGYASAVDGDTVTDGSCTFRAGWRFKMSKVLNVNLAGNILTQVVMGSVSTKIFIDPAPVLT